MKVNSKVIYAFIFIFIFALSIFVGYYFLSDFFSGNTAYYSEQEITTPLPSPTSLTFNDDSLLTQTIFHPTVDFQSSIDNFNIASISELWLGETLKSDASNETNTIYESTHIITINSDLEADLINLKVINNDTDEIVLSENITDSVIPIMDKQANYKYIVEFTWNDSNLMYKGIYTYTFNLYIDLPISFKIDKHSVYQGDMIKIDIYNVNEDEIPIFNQSISDKFKLFKIGSTYTAYLPAGYYTWPGKYDISYGVEGEELSYDSLEVLAYPFNIQYLYIDETIASSTKNEESSAQYAKYFAPVRLQSNDEKYYTEEFIIPAYGNLSTEFGMNRYVNGAPTSYHHSGLDIGNIIGYPILATNTGKVVLSMNLIMTGNTIVIDHGQGIFSVYFHMDKLYVDEGEMVNRGQQIGEMGTTGFSTGSHLHFTMSYYDTNIEPGYLLVGEPITKKITKNT